jgi:hypothetical protein
MARRSLPTAVHASWAQAVSPNLDAAFTLCCLLDHELRGILPESTSQRPVCRLADHVLPALYENEDCWSSGRHGPHDRRVAVLRPRDNPISGPASLAYRPEDRWTRPSITSGERRKGVDRIGGVREPQDSSKLRSHRPRAPCVTNDEQSGHCRRRPEAFPAMPRRQRGCLVFRPPDELFEPPEFGLDFSRHEDALLLVEESQVDPTPCRFANPELSEAVPALVDQGKE